jgi:WD40 repeat protein
MTNPSVATFIDTLRRNRLLQPAQLDELTRKLQARHKDPYTLAQDLMQRGWLTPDQVINLFKSPIPAIQPAPPAAMPVAVPVGAPAAVAAKSAPPLAVAMPATSVKPVTRSHQQAKARVGGSWLKWNLIGVLVLLALGANFYFLYQFVNQQADPPLLGIGLLELGLVVALAGSIWFLTVAFGQSIWWGLGSLLVPVVAFVFLFKHFAKVVLPFAVNLLGVAIAAIGVFQGDLVQYITQPPKSAAAKLNRELERQAQREFETVELHFSNPGANLEQLRREIVAFRAKFEGTLTSIRAAEMLYQLPSPLDQLNRTSIPSQELYEGIPKHIVAVLGERRWRHWGAARAVAFSANGSTYASAGDDGVIRFWDVKEGREQSSVPADQPLSLLFTKDGQQFAAGTADGKVTVWEADSRSTTVQGPVKSPTAMAVSADAKLAASAQEDGKVILWDRATGQTKATLTGHTAKVAAMTFSPNGKLLASGGSESIVRIWNVERGDAERTLDGGPVRALAFDPEGKQLASGGDGKTIKVFETETGKEVIVLKGHQAAVSAVAFSSNGEALVSGGVDGVILLWDTLNEGPRQGTQAHAGPVTSVVYGPDGKRVGSAGTDGLVRLWSADKVEADTFFRGHRGPLTALTFTPDSNLLATASRDKTLRIWDVTRLQASEGQAGSRAKLEGHKEAVMSVASTPDGRTLLSGSLDRTLRLWDVVNGQSQVTPEQQSDIYSVAYGPGGKTMIIGGGVGPKPPSYGDVRLWDTSTNQEKWLYKDHGNLVLAVGPSPDGSLIASASLDGTVKLFDADSGQEQGTLQDSSGVTTVAFSPDGKTLATGNQSGAVKLWDVAERKERLALAVPAGLGVTSVAFSADGKSLAAARLDGWLIVWDLAGAKKDTDYQRFKLPGAIAAVAFAPDSRHLATANANSTAYIFRLAAFRPKK